jgi:hypothetical protein
LVLVWFGVKFYPKPKPKHTPQTPKTNKTLVRMKYGRFREASLGLIAL